MTHSRQRYLVSVCQHRSCSRSGSEEVLKAFQRHQSATLMVSGCECQGQCGSGPTVRVMPEDIWYCRVQPEDVDTIVENHLKANGKPVKSLQNPRMHPSHSAYANLAAQYEAYSQPQQGE
ncbi:MAG: (2Fe-2S) ferredoxin domain-containing protein [Leptolyngbya sp. SIOISBB]|nr:(2Fe-2S) ferredoxin domain-containing protein [Leptolyngbya sp. SIOISBB]